MSAQFCEFQAEGDGQRCTRCGFYVPVAAPQRVAKNCAAAPVNGKPAIAGDPTACVHRGDVLRTVSCKTCNSAAVEVHVNACALHGQCVLRDYTRANPELAGVKVCTGCADRKPGEPALPPQWKRIVNFGGAVLRDRASGRPRRSPDLVERIFDSQCRRCPRYNAVEKACAECGCHVSPNVDELNKLHWQSEKCPLGRWPIERLNLMFYILPLQHTGRVWQWHVEQLRQRLHLFNGRRLVTIATPGPGNLLAIEPAQKVREAFGSDADSIEFIERPNDPLLWETPAFFNMLRMLADQRQGEEATGRQGDSSFASSPLRPLAVSSPPSSPPSATFYAHAKGVRRARWDSIRLWCEAMYRHNLDRIDEVREILGGYPCCGVGKIPAQPQALGGHGWHFAGTYFWFRNEALFARPNWHVQHNHSHTVEAYLSWHFREDQAYCLAYDKPSHVYNASTWLDKEAEKREGCKPRTRVSILVTSCNYGRYLAECLQSCLKQTYRCEVICVDDASDDDSLEVARSLGPAIKLIALPKRLGAEAARNQAARYATGDALLFVDSDNVLPPDYVERMLEKLTPETPFVYPDLQRFGDDDTLFVAPEWPEVDLTEHNCADTCSLMWREAFEKAGGWKPGFHFADWHLFLRLSRFGTPRRAGVALGYRVHSASAQARAALTPEQVDELRRRVVADALGA